MIIYQVQFHSFSDQPDAPSPIESVMSTARSLKIQWRPGFDGNTPIRNYRLEMKESHETWTIGNFYSIPGNESEYMVSGLRPGFTYTFRIHAINKYGNGPYSPESILQTNEEGKLFLQLNLVTDDSRYFRYFYIGLNFRHYLVCFFLLHKRE